MESTVPGSDDDPASIELSSLKMQETEQERLLNIKVVLPNGKQQSVFDLSYVNGAEHWFCNACKCPVMGRVYQHENGRRHAVSLANLDWQEVPGKSADSMKLAPGEPAPPGYENDMERVSLIQERLDGFNVGPLVALEYLLELQDFDPSKEPFYLCILCDKRGDPRTVLTHLASYNHISQYLQKHFPTCYRALAPYMTKQHRRNWQSTLQKIAEAIEKKYGRLRPMPVEKERFDKDRMYFLQLVCRGQHYSEQLGHTFEELIVHDELIKGYEDEKRYPVVEHFPLKRSPSPPVVARPTKSKNPTTVTTPKKDENPPETPSPATSKIRKRSLSSISSFSSSSLSDFEPGKSQRKKSKERERPKRSPERRRRRSPSPRRSDYHRRESSYSRRRPEERSRDKYDEFRRQVRILDGDMDKVLQNHVKNPEKHPQYNDEWKKFWNKRYKELQGEGVDVSKYDFKPEWIKYWNKKMRDLHAEEVKSRKDALRRKLGLPEEPAPISFRIGVKPMPKPLDQNIRASIAEKMSSSGDKKPLPMAAQPDQDNEVIVIEDKDDDVEEVTVKPIRRRSAERRRRRTYSRSPSPGRYRRRRSPVRSRRSRSRSYEGRYIERKHRERESSFERDLRATDRVRLVSDLPWEREKMYKTYDEYAPPPVMRSATRAPVLTPQIPPVAPQEEEDDDSDINVVGVLRLLTALEEKLGSLGPKIIDLLAKALAMEKHEANSSENLLDNDINCVLFETVKEKLKGQLQAGLVDGVQERAFKKAIKKTASLIHLSGERKKVLEKNKVVKVEPLKVPGVGDVDKSAIAKQIANALILQGKTDVTQDQLEQLINAVVGIAEASKNTNQPLTTASFLEKFSFGTPTEVKVTPSVAPKAPEVLPPKTPINNMDHLSESDLQTLLQNFKDLSTDEQHGLINYLKKLEAHEPERVERLRKFVNLGGPKPQALPPKVDMFEPPPTKSDRASPFSASRLGTSSNPSNEQAKKPKLVDSDEEDYTFDDVVQAVSKNVQEQERKSAIDLTDAKALISNLMSNINKPTLGLVNTPTTNDFARTLNNLPINMDSLASIVGNVKRLESQATPQMKFEPPPGINPNSFSGIQGPSSFVPPVQQNLVQYPIKGQYGYGGGAPTMFNRPMGGAFDPRANVRFSPMQQQQVRPMNFNVRPQNNPNNNGGYRW